MIADDSPENEVTTSSPRETDTGTRLVGTRACIRCHHELDGQPIIRLDPEGLLVARCPECGRASPILEYPVLGHWGSRLGISLLLIYIVIAIAAVLSLATACFAIALEITQPTTRRFSDFVQSKWEATPKALTPETYDPWRTEVAWWNESGPAILAEFEAASGLGFKSLPMTEMGGFLLFSVAFGVIWAGLFAGVRRSRLWILPIVSYVITMGLAISVTTIGDGPLVAVWDIAESVRIRHLLPIALLAGTVGLEIGVLFGRPLIVKLAGLLLPPNRRHDIESLWRVDRKH